MNATPCKLCEKKRAKRHCPGVNGEICPSCCGAERENSIDCPPDCDFLRESRLHQAPVDLDPDALPNSDIKLNEEFISQQEGLITWLSLALSQAIENARAVDNDAREALAALIQTYRTMESGLIYETKSPNVYATRIQTDLKHSIEDLRKRLAEETGMHQLRDSDVLKTLVFLQRLELQHSNGRRRGRAFFDFLRTYFPAESALSVNQ